MTAAHYEGKQVVLLDEQGQEISRFPDTYSPNTLKLYTGSVSYRYCRSALENGSHRRYFKRVRSEER